LASRLFGHGNPRPEHRRRIASARHGRRHGPAASPDPGCNIASSDSRRASIR
jgi:hypothetical protein